jgi:Fe-S cluster biogenesis protein NfuA|tara:strand:- start:337 stop:600 length:264 start_codon:yes stop_codon:yes gene_type:complete
VTTSSDIEQILEEQISPYLSLHGGAIELLDYNNETRNVHVKLTGSCAGCSASTITIKIGVENVLLSTFPDTIKSVTHEEGEVISPFY